MPKLISINKTKQKPEKFGCGTFSFIQKQKIACVSNCGNCFFFWSFIFDGSSITINMKFNSLLCHCMTDNAILQAATISVSLFGFLLNFEFRFKTEIILINETMKCGFVSNSCICMSGKKLWTYRMPYRIKFYFYSFLAMAKIIHVKIKHLTDIFLNSMNAAAAHKFSLFMVLNISNEFYYWCWLILCMLFMPSIEMKAVYIILLCNCGSEWNPFKCIEKK